MVLPPDEYNLRRDKLLPHVDGPKLWAFKYRKSPIEIVRLLSDPVGRDDPDSSSGGHGHVFEVLIRNRRFALKVVSHFWSTALSSSGFTMLQFHFYDVFKARKNTFPIQNRKVDNFTMEYHSDPFFAECRAYGRIHEIQEKRRKKFPNMPDIAVPCYGFVALPAIYEKEFQEKYGITEWNRLPEDRERDLEKRSSFRAIVKKLMPKGDPIRNPKKMASDFRLLQKSGIIQHDVFARNYMEGLLVDFSLAWTKPHWVIDAVSPTRINDRVEEDCEDFDRMLLDAGIKVNFRVSRTKSTYHKLRPLEDQPFRRDMQKFILQYDRPFESLP